MPAIGHRPWVRDGSAELAPAAEVVMMLGVLWSMWEGVTATGMALGKKTFRASEAGAYWGDMFTAPLGLKIDKPL